MTPRRIQPARMRQCRNYDNCFYNIYYDKKFLHDTMIILKIPKRQLPEYEIVGQYAFSFKAAAQISSVCVNGWTKTRTATRLLSHIRRPTHRRLQTTFLYFLAGTSVLIKLHPILRCFFASMTTLFYMRRPTTAGTFETCFYLDSKQLPIASIHTPDAALKCSIS